MLNFMDQFAHDLSCPQPKVKPVLHRVLAVDPAKHLPLLHRVSLRGRPVPLREASALIPLPRLDACRSHLYIVVRQNP